LNEIDTAYRRENKTKLQKLIAVKAQWFFSRKGKGSRGQSWQPAVGSGQSYMLLKQQTAADDCHLIAVVCCQVWTIHVRHSSM